MKRFEVKISKTDKVLVEAENNKALLSFVEIAKRLIEMGVEPKRACKAAEMRLIAKGLNLKVINRRDAGLTAEQIAERERQRGFTLYSFCCELDKRGWKEIKIGEGSFLDSEQVTAVWKKQLVSFFLAKHDYDNLEVGIYSNPFTSTIEANGSIRFEKYRKHMPKIVEMVKEYAEFIYEHPHNFSAVNAEFKRLKEKYPGIVCGRESDFGNHEHMSRMA